MKIGDQIPNVCCSDQSGEEVCLTSFLGKKLAVFFYPADMTPGCTAEACNLRDNYPALLREGFTLIGVSTDSVAKHKKFIEKYDLPFPLLADTDKTIVNAFGVYGPKTFMGKMFEGTHRKTFIFDENGTLTHVIEKVKTADHAKQIMETLTLV
jgi:thioredoxin-dependent peroxiredoxin